MPSMGPGPPAFWSVPDGSAPTARSPPPGPVERRSVLWSDGERAAAQVDGGGQDDVHGGASEGDLQLLAGVSPHALQPGDRGPFRDWGLGVS